MYRKFIIAILLSLSCALQAQDEGLPLVVAHRGGAGDGVENTLSCIERSVVAGVDAVEVDVRMTADGCLVVFHDAKVNAKTDGKGRVAGMMLAELQRLHVKNECGEVTTETIPTLQDVLRLVNGRCMVLVEVKDTRSGVEERLIADVLACNAAGWVAVQSFHDGVLRRLHELAAPFPLEKLAVFKVPLLPLLFDGTLRRFSFEKYSYISSFNFNRRCLPRSLARKIKNAGRAVKVWTLSNPSELPRAEVDAVIVDNPSLWLQGGK